MKLECCTLLLVAAFLPAWAQPTREGSFPPPGYVLKFVDDFNGTALDTSKWMYRTDSKALSTQLARNVRLDGGSLVIDLKKETASDKSYTGGGVISRQRFGFGYFEARVKMHGAAGWHQAVWAMATPDGSTTYPEMIRTEIDGIEFDSDLPAKAHMGLIIWNGPKSSRTLTCSPGVYRSPLGFDASDAFHTYGFEYTPASVRYYVDGDLRCVLDYPQSAGEHDPLNLWLTAIAYEQRARGKGAAENVDDSRLPGRMLVDFAAFYTKEEK
jgi:beta-glucanase (GH16 family)